MHTRKKEESGTDLMRLLKITLILVSVIAVCATPAAAQDSKQDLKDQMSAVGDFLAFVIAAVAIPNGAFGVFQYMTAGTDTEQSEKGRKRIRNSFIGVAGATAVVTAVQVLNSSFL